MAIETKTNGLEAGHGLLPQESDSNAPESWDVFVQSHAGGALLQLDAWQSLKCRFGWTGGAAVVREEGRLVGGARILYRRAYGLTLAYVPRGPIVDWRDGAAVARVLRAVEAEARHAGASVLKLEPPILDSLDARAQMYALGYTPSLQTVQPPSTIRVALAGDESTLLQRMKSKWRYNVRLATRKGVTVRPATRSDLAVFNRMMETTGERDGFSVHSDAYYSAAFDLLAPQHAVYLLAEYADRPLAAIVVALCGDTATYLWGASNNEERNRMPNHALQWAGMLWAKACGAIWYDLWGVPDAIGLLALGMHGGKQAQWPADELPIDMDCLPGHDLWGVYRFKQGFGGEAIRYVGAWDKSISPVGGALYAVGLQARAWLQSARQKRSATVEAIHAPGGRTTQAAEAVAEIADRDAWQGALTGFDAPHVLQSWEWGMVKAQTGWSAHRFVWTGEGDTPDAAFQLLCRRLAPGLPWSIGYIPKGPIADWANLGNVDALLAAVEATARRMGCIMVKIDPDVAEDSPVGTAMLRALRQRGWRYSPSQIQFKNTALTQLNDSDATQALATADLSDQLAGSAEEAVLLAGMKSKWRYNIRLAARRNVRVRAAGLVELPLFYGMYAQTGVRDGFLVRPYGYYLETWRTFLEAEADPGNPAGGALLLAEHPDEIEPLAGLFLMRYRDRAWYFYGASSDRRRRDMPNYLLQWEALRWSLARGCRVYDWWGAPTNLDDPEDGMQGVWQFKQGFGATYRAHIGAWDFPVYPRAYTLFTQALPRVLALLRGR